jgi:hypothetical protein
MAAMSNYLRQALLDHLFRSTAMPQPNTIALALCTVAVVDTDTGDLTGKEVVGPGYARVNVGRGDNFWSAGTTTMNPSPIVWPTATGNWTGPIIYVAVLDDVTIGQGNLLFYGALSQPRTINSGDIFVFNINQMAVRPG